MLKKRLAATLILKDSIVVQSIGFKRYLPIGKPEIAIEYLSNWGIDEIILLDISARSIGRLPSFDLIRRATEKCFVPLTVGGGINKVSDIELLMNSGADKVSINHQAIYNPSFISEAAKLFGEQCIVVSIDAIKTSDGYLVYDYLTGKSIDKHPAEFALELTKYGAGEILINSVDKDGSYSGFDLDLINLVCSKVNVPIIAAGGARNAQDFINVFNLTNVSAASAGNFFHFTEHSVITTKANLKNHTNIRLDTFTNYEDNMFDGDFRLLKREEIELEKMLFLRIEKEEI